MALSYKVKTQPKANRKRLGLYTYTTPNIVIVGDKKLRSKMNKFEQNFNVDLVFVKPKYLPKVIGKQTIAVVIDEKKLGRKSNVYTDKVLESYKMTPVFYLARKTKNENDIHLMYERGVYGVIDWPMQAEVLPNLIIEALKPHPKATGKSKGDFQLSEIVKTVLNIGGGYKNIEVKVIDGFVFLTGRVNSVFDKTLIEDQVSNILGVKKLITKDVRIEAELNISDQELERKITMFIGTHLSSDKRTLSAIVRNRRVKLMGAVKRQEDLEIIKRFAEKLPGIVEVINDAKITSAVVSKNSMMARKLEAKAKNLFEGVKQISIKLYGDFAEVSGVVSMKDDRKLIERYLLQVLPVKSVINKMSVTS